MAKLQNPSQTFGLTDKQSLSHQMNVCQTKQEIYTILTKSVGHVRSSEKVWT